MSSSTATSRLNGWERALVVAFLIAWLPFGLLVEKRSAYLHRRMGDLGVYLRAGWAVRAGGEPLYRITCDNGWHYCYPPLLAVLMTPLADPPVRAVTRAGTASVGVLGVPGAGPLLAVSALAADSVPLEPDEPPAVPYVPYAVSVALCYVLNLLCLALAVHLLARALEATSSRPEVRRLSVGCARWWYLRAFPVLVCLPPIGHTLMRGQVNLVLLLAVCGICAALLRGARFRAGLWLAGAICVKIFPAYLLLVPLWRRDGRCLAGCLAGLAVGLILVPVLALGPARTLACYADLSRVLIRPALNLGDDQSRAKELIEVTATDSQAFLVALHNTLHPNPATRPATAAPAVRAAHWLLSAFFTLLTLAAAFRGRGRAASPAVPLFVGALGLIMILTSPVCHTHYFVLAVPVIMGLLAHRWEENGGARPSPGLIVLLAVYLVGNILPLLPVLLVLRDRGLAMYVTLLLWAVACHSLSRPSRPAPARQALRPAA